METAVRTQALTREEAVDFSRLTVLIIDDNAHMRAIIKELLRSFGMMGDTILEASDGADALSVMLDAWVDIVVCDWMMPSMDGIEFVRHLRTADDSPAKRVPVIMLTGHTEAARVRQARDAGVTEFLAKPVSSGSLFDRMRRVIMYPRPFISSKFYTGPCRRRRLHNPNYAGPERRKNPWPAEGM